MNNIKVIKMATNNKTIMVLVMGLPKDNFDVNGIVTSINVLTVSDNITITTAMGTSITKPVIVVFLKN